jgi:hypothetical protein
MLAARNANREAANGGIAGDMEILAAADISI